MIDITSLSGRQSRVLKVPSQESETIPVRDVEIKAFHIGKYEVTFEEYDRFAIATGRPLPWDNGWRRDNMPVCNVSWEDTVAYTNWLSEARQAVSIAYRIRVGIRISKRWEC